MKKTEKQKIGSLGEEIATKFLEKNGFYLIERNYRKKWGEIDLICEKDAVVRFVEVKTMSKSDFSRENIYDPEEHVTSDKLRKIARTASLYMESTNDRREYQIDVVAVVLNHADRIARCRLYEQVLG